MSVNLKWLLLLWCSVYACDGYRILFLLPSAPPSHVRFANAIINTLAEEGHTITFLTVKKSDKDRPNVKEIYIDSNIMTTVFPNLFNLTSLEFVRTYIMDIPAECVKSLQHPATTEALSGDYDIVFITAYACDCYYYSIYEKKIPFIMVSPNTPSGFHWTNAGIPPFPTVSASRNLALYHPMNLMERIISTLMESGEEFLMYNVHLRSMQVKCEEAGFCSPTGPTLLEITQNNPFYLFNSIQTLEKPIRPTSLSMIYVGGIHLTEINETLDLSDWINGSEKDGFIVFSLGSFVNTREVNDENIMVLFNVFSKLKENIIMKWDTEVKLPVPSNIKLVKWLPQQQLLAHPRIKLFVTHGGLLSTMEAMYYGVPLVGLPVFGDQLNNMAICARDGWALFLQWKYLSEKELENQITRVLHDPNFKKKAMEYSVIMRDRQNSPKEELIYWTEYLIRHNGASHLKSAFAEMPWYKVYNVDVWFIITGTIGALLATMIYLMLACLQCAFGKKNKLKKE